jgi:heat-inducible transcriptional repressor
MDKHIDKRAQAILASIVEHYINHGEPIASKTLAAFSPTGLSSASIRNIMAELEAAGYLLQPHTSAGRVPTVLAYRLFVDSLLTTQELSADHFGQLKQQLRPSDSTQHLVKQTSTLLSGLTSLAGMVTVPRAQRLTLRQIEFLPLSERRVLVILVLNDKEVQNRIIHTEKQYTDSELQVATQFLNAHFAGKELAEIQKELLDDMVKDKTNLDEYLQIVLTISRQALEDVPEAEEDELVMAGERNLIAQSDLHSVDQVRALLDAFAKKRDMLHLLEQCLHAPGLQIFIGEESGFDAFGDFSVIASPYRANGRVVGVLGVIGPTRMNYEKVIPLVDVTAKLLSAALEEK